MLRNRDVCDYCCYGGLDMFEVEAAVVALVVGVSAVAVI